MAAIPDKAHSAGTIIALGADRLVMTRKATLGPIDPHEASPLAPKDQDGEMFPASVEAVEGCIALAREEPRAVERTASFLCGGCGSHDYMISRREAKEELCLQVEYPDEELERLIDAICLDLTRELMGPALQLVERADVKSVKSGFIESLQGSSCYSFGCQVTQDPPRLLHQGWH